jgi:hypothetical protein
MNNCNFTGIRMKAADWNKLPATLRKVEDGALMILSAGTYRPVLIVDR